MEENEYSLAGDWRPGKKRYPLVVPNIAGWNIPIFNRKYIFNGSIFQPAMLVYQGVFQVTKCRQAFISIFLERSFLSRVLKNGSLTLINGVCKIIT